MTKIKVNKQNKKVEENNEIKKLGKILVYIILVISITYFLTVLFVEGPTNTNTSEVEDNDTVDTKVDYNSISAGQTFKMKDNEYYVVFYDVSNKDNLFITSMITGYTNGKVYTVDLSKALNKAIISKETNPSVQTITDLKVSDPTLIKIEAGKNILYTEGFTNIMQELK